jgi:7,8-dihydropterin-6-yl-methyl-4-(beta-D-ribofuranosyl)aminobenzene 5'-phosphate synthase
MNNLIDVDSLDVLIVVDNLVDSLSSTPGYVEGEWTRLWARGLSSISGRCLCCGAHGLSCAISVRFGDSERTLLFDTGPDEAVFERNVNRLGFDMGSIDGVVLSHGHWDHAGAMVRALDMIQLKNRGRPVPTFMHPGMYRPRAVKTANGSIHRFEDVPKADELESHGARVVHATEPAVILEGAFYVSGEIPRVTAFETGMQEQYRLAANGVDWEPDPLIVDERYAAVSVRGKGMVIFTACSHAGVVNVLKDARERFPSMPLHGILGGFHLSGPKEKFIPETVTALKEFGLTTIAPAHCTGWRAVGALLHVFGTAVVPASVGTRYRF